jgi:hypothetical protein
MSLFLAILLNGESAERAKQEAAKTVGPGFALHVTSLYINDSAGHKSISAVVTAWNDNEVRAFRCDGRRGIDVAYSFAAEIRPIVVSQGNRWGFGQFGGRNGESRHRSGGIFLAN